MKKRLLYFRLIFNDMLLSASQLISKSFDLYSKNRMVFLPYIVLIFFPTLLTTGGAALFKYELLLHPGIGDTTLRTWILVFCVSILLVSIVSGWLSIALLRLSARITNNEAPITLKENLKTSARFIWPCITTSILSAFFILCGLIFFIVPGIILSIWFAFSTYTVVLDGKKNMNALKTSKALVTGRWWSIFWRLFAPVFIFLFAGWLIKSILPSPLLLIPAFAPYYPMAKTVLDIIISLAMIPFTILASTLLYFNATVTPMKAEVAETK